jgi:hypothetical protein
MMTATSSMSTAEITVICGHGAAKNFTFYPSSEIIDYEVVPKLIVIQREVIRPMSIEIKDL